MSKKAEMEAALEGRSSIKAVNTHRQQYTTSSVGVPEEQLDLRGKIIPNPPEYREDSFAAAQPLERALALPRIPLVLGTHKYTQRTTRALVEGDRTNGEDGVLASLDYMSTWASTFLYEAPLHGGPGCPTALFTHSAEGRAAKWEALRDVHAIVYKERQTRVVSIENTLWEVARKDGRVACDLFCSALCSAYNRAGIDPHLRMEERLAKAYHRFEGAEVDAVDYREFVVCLRILENFGEIAKKARGMLLRFYDMWATDSGSIARLDALKLIGIAAETDQELHATRVMFDHAVTDMAGAYGLKPSTTEVPRDLFMEVLEAVPTLVVSFRECMWKRGEDEMRYGLA